jgi:hypothetical protein
VSRKGGKAVIASCHVCDGRWDACVVCHVFGVFGGGVTQHVLDQAHCTAICTGVSSGGTTNA